MSERSALGNAVFLFLVPVLGLGVALGLVLARRDPRGAVSLALALLSSGLALLLVRRVLAGSGGRVGRIFKEAPSILRKMVLAVAYLCLVVGGMLALMVVGLNA